MSDLYRLTTRRGKAAGEFLTEVTYNGEKVNGFDISEQLTDMIENYRRMNVRTLMDNPKISILEVSIIGDLRK